MYDEFWDAIVDLGLPPSFHILTSRSDTPVSGHVRGPKLNTFMTIIRGNQDIIGTLIFGAVFERHPDLRVVCVEADAGWAPHWMYRADHALRPAPQLADRGRADAAGRARRSASTCTSRSRTTGSRSAPPTS